MPAARITSTMQDDFPLTITTILQHGARVFGRSECVTWQGDGARHTSYREIEQNARRLARALTRLGVGAGDPVATFCWNNQEHLEAYYAVSCMGAVVHTLNIRLPAHQVTHIVNDAQDKIIIVDGSLLPALAPVVGTFTSVEAYIVIGEGDTSLLGDRPVYAYDELLAAEEPAFVWPELDERSAAVMCYTSGTTGDPRGVVFSHRSTYLHAVSTLQSACVGTGEASPVGGLARPPAGIEPGTAEEMDYRMKSGRLLAGVQMRIVTPDGQELPWDGESTGEIEVRGPWITARYFGGAQPEKFHDGWLRTGDIGTMDDEGYFQISDRLKDVIKSGGEWISSVELENLLAGSPHVVEAAVIGIPDEKWTERPLACVVVSQDTDPVTLAEFLVGKVAHWQIPENWAFIEEVPKTTVGKFDKKVLRARYRSGDLDVQRTRD